jgi:DNA ligase 1
VFRTVRKVGTGFSDAELAALPERLAPLAQEQRPARVDARMIPDVWFEPSPVVEALGGRAHRLPNHTAAWARPRRTPAWPLRFTGRYRDDKSPEDATTVQESWSCTAPPARPRPAPDRYGLGAAG